MKRIKLICNLAVAAIMVITLFSVPWAEAADQGAKPRVLKFSSFLTPSHIIMPELNRFLKRLEKASGGEVVIQFYGSEALGKAKEQYDVVKEGLADMANISQSYNPNIFRLTAIVGWPFATDSGIVGTDVLHELYKRGIIADEYKDIHVLLNNACTPDHMFSRKKLEKIDDFKGLRVIANTPAANQMWKSLGASGHPMGIADVYTALQRGTADAIQRSWAASLSWKWQEVVPYAIDISILGGGPVAVIMNKDSWNKLSPKTQQAWNKICEEEKYLIPKSYAISDVAARKIWADLGKVSVFPLTEKEKVAQKMIPIWENVVNDLEAKGYRAKEAYKIYVEVMKKHKQPVLIKIPGLYKE